MRRKLLLFLLVAAALAWVGVGVDARLARADRPPPPAGELRGAWHVHTTASDGRGTLDEVVAAAREAGLQFVVITDHNVLGPAAPAWRDGVLVIPATEASTRLGHVVAVGLPRALDRDEREGDPLAAIAALGGKAVLAHPLHPRRPFRGFGGGPWQGFEVVSNDTAWGSAVARRELRRILSAALVLPWDPPRAILTLADDPADELAFFDAELRQSRAGIRPAAATPGPGAAPRVLLCSADAHGLPSYGAAFGAFSMHVPVTPSGDAARDAAEVVAALLDGRAACVHDGVAPASGVALRAVAGGGLELAVRSPALPRARVRLVRDGARGEPLPAATGEALLLGAGALCPGGRCAPGDYRVEVHLDGRPWIFTNPVRIE